MYIFIDKYQDGNINTANFLGDLKNSDELGLDTETTSLDTFTAKWLLLQLEINGKIYILDVRKLGINFIKYIITLIKDTDKKIVAHNSKFDLKIIQQNTGELLTNVYDTMILEVLINQGIGKQYYSLEELVNKYTFVIINKEIRETFADYDREFFSNEQLLYSALDVKYLREIKDYQLKTLKKQKQLSVVDIESKLIAPVTSMEINGVRLNEKGWLELSEKFTVESKKYEGEFLTSIFNKLNKTKYKNMLEFADDLIIPFTTKKSRKELESIPFMEDCFPWFKENFNINSRPQVRRIFNLTGLNINSTGKKVLEPFYNTVPEIKILLNYREAIKRVTTYGQNFIDEIHPVTKRLHVEFNQVGTYTGRFAVSRMQQIPTDMEFRKNFIARESYKILSADYSQQEYRLLGALTGEPKIIEAYLNDKDVHTATAAILYNVKSLDDVTDKQRSRGKGVNFAMIYGSTPAGLSYTFGLSLTEAEDLWHLYYKGYPVLKQVMDFTQDIIWKQKKAVTPLGRIRHFKEQTLFKDNYEYERYKRRIMREGWNHMIQGWGADITKIAMNYIFYKNPFSENDLYFYLQNHDEIDLEIIEDKSKDIGEFVKECMLEAEQPFLKEIPAKVEFRVLDYWSK